MADQPSAADPTAPFAVDPDGLAMGVRLLAATPPSDTPVDLPALDGTGEGIGAAAALQALAPAVLGGAAPLGDPGYLAHMDPPTPWVTWVAHLWAARLNQNLLHPDTGAVARRLEAQVVAALAPVWGMAGGHLVPGSTLANLTALWAARDIAGVTEVVASPAAHVSVAKAARVLGLAHRTAPTDARQRLDPDRLGELSRAALVLTAGTTGTGAVDPLDIDHGAGWVHVDAAWAGPLRLSDTWGHLLDGIDRADSVAVSGHKWLFQPKESALVLFADADRAHRALAVGGDYLAVPNVGLQGSHGLAPALALALTLLAHGRAGMAGWVEHGMALADRLSSRIAAEPRLEQWGDGPGTGVVAWRPVGEDPTAVRDRLRDATVSLTRIDGQPWLRSVAANPHADPDRVVDAVLVASGAGRM